MTVDMQKMRKAYVVSAHLRTTSSLSLAKGVVSVEYRHEEGGRNKAYVVSAHLRTKSSLEVTVVSINRRH